MESLQPIQWFKIDLHGSKSTNESLLRRAYHFAEL